MTQTQEASMAKAVEYPAPDGSRLIAWQVPFPSRWIAPKRSRQRFDDELNQAHAEALAYKHKVEFHAGPGALEIYVTIPPRR